MTQNYHKITIATLAKLHNTCATIGTCWQDAIGKPNPDKLHPCGDILRGIEPLVTQNKNILYRLQHVRKIDDNLPAYGMINLIIENARNVCAFSDNHIQTYIRTCGAPPDCDKISECVQEARTLIDQATTRITAVHNATSNRELFAYGTHIKEIAKNAPPIPKRPAKPRADNKTRVKAKRGKLQG